MRTLYQVLPEDFQWLKEHGMHNDDGFYVCKSTGEAIAVTIIMVLTIHQGGMYPHEYAHPWCETCRSNTKTPHVRILMSLN